MCSNNNHNLLPWLPTHPLTHTWTNMEIIFVFDANAERISPILFSVTTTRGRTLPQQPHFWFIHNNTLIINYQVQVVAQKNVTRQYLHQDGLYNPLRQIRHSPSVLQGLFTLGYMEAEAHFKESWPPHHNTKKIRAGGMWQGSKIVCSQDLPVRMGFQLCLRKTQS